MRTFFFYGTLIDQDVRRAVLGPVADSMEPEPATLIGWHRVRLQGRDYPVIVPRRGAAVEGCIVGGLPASAVAKLVRFEGAEYSLTQVEIVGESGEPMKAHTFVGSGQTPPSSIPWRYDEWRGSERPAFLRRVARHRG